jgi:hypothetical protein
MEILFDLVSRYNSRFSLVGADRQKFEDDFHLAVRSAFQGWGASVPREEVVKYGSLLEKTIILATNRIPTVEGVYPSLREVVLRFNYPTPPRITEAFVSLTPRAILVKHQDNNFREVVYPMSWEPAPQPWSILRTRDEKIAAYRNFFADQVKEVLVVVGAGATGKSFALRDAGPLPQRCLISYSPDEPAVMLESEVADGPRAVKMVYHRLGHDTLTRALAAQPNGTLVEFQDQYVSELQETEKDFYRWIRKAPASERDGSSILAMLASLRDEYIQVLLDISSPTKLYFTYGPQKVNDCVFLTPNQITDSSGRVWSREWPAA